MVWTIKLLIIFGATATYGGSINSTRQDTSNTNITWNNSNVVVAEGVKISTDFINQHTNKRIHNITSTLPLAPTTNATLTKNETQIANVTSNSNNTITSTTSSTTTAAPPKIIINYVYPSTAAPNSTTTSSTTTLKINPANEIEVGEKNDNKMSVPKKGFGVNETGELPSSASTTTTAISRPKKPTVTIGNDDTFDNFGDNATRSIVNPIMNLSPVSQKTDYVVPIVGVILSVPLVAILLNLMYKKSKDWWQYRHYKRMDLIDGIYNN